MDDKETVSEADSTLPDDAQLIKRWGPEAVTALRLDLGLSQKRFAALLGVSRPTVSSWENGKSEVRPLNAISLDRIAQKGVHWDHPTAPERQPPQAPPAQTPDFWRGVLYAAENMSETVTKLLREQREAADRAAAEQARSG